MKFYYSIIFITFTHLLSAQDISQNELTIEYHFGLNANAYTKDDVAKPFLDEGLGHGGGVDLSYIVYTKKNRIFKFSYSFNILDHLISPSNLTYEFGYDDDDDDCCSRFISTQLMTGRTEYLIKFYDENKIKILGGIGLGLNLDISSSSGGLTYEGRTYWSEYDTKTGPKVFPSYDLSTQLIYNLSAYFLITTNLSFTHAPFDVLDFEYNISSRDGTFSGLFHQKLLGVNLSIGVGMRL